jgi:hypothetical protein
MSNTIIYFIYKHNNNNFFNNYQFSYLEKKNIKDRKNHI